MALLAKFFCFVLLLSLVISSLCEDQEVEAVQAPGTPRTPGSSRTPGPRAPTPTSRPDPPPPSCPYPCCKDEDCGRTSPYCENHKCVECRYPSQCPPSGETSCGAYCASSGSCYRGEDCARQGLHCDQGSCVECTHSYQCEGEKMCNTRTNKCVDCFDSSSCKNSDSACGRTCDLDGQCTGGFDCLGSIDPLQCDERRGKCVECRTASHCKKYYASRPYCFDNVCVKCADNRHCPQDSDKSCGSYCTSSSHTCTPGINCFAKGKYCLDSYQCVECRTSVDCSSTRSVCLPYAHTCVECDSDTQCPKTKFCDARCSPSSNQCVGSLVCPKHQLCDTKTSRCVDCFSKSDCTDPSKPYCDAKGACVECLKSDICRNDTNCNALCVQGSCARIGLVLDCPSLNSSTPHCKASSSTCVECTEEPHCSSPTPFCLGNSCKQCKADMNCVAFPDTPHCSRVTNMCVECNVNADCRDDEHCDAVCSPDGTCSKSSTNCSSDGKVCDKKQGRCFECLGDENCVGKGRPICTRGTCSECELDSSCRSDSSCDATCDDRSLPYKCSHAPSPLTCPSPEYCDLPRGACIECILNSDCKNSKFGTVCDLKTKMCGQCINDNVCRSVRACNATCVMGRHNTCENRESTVCAPNEQCEESHGLCFSGQFCTSDQSCASAPNPFCSPLNNCTECLIVDHCVSDTQCGYKCENYTCIGGVTCDSGFKCHNATSACVECGIEGTSCSFFNTCSQFKCRFQYLWLILPIGLLLIIIVVIVFFYCKRRNDRLVRNYSADEAEKKLLQQTDMATF